MLYDYGLFLIFYYFDIILYYFFDTIGIYSQIPINALLLLFFKLLKNQFFSVEYSVRIKLQPITDDHYPAFAAQRPV